MDPMSSQGSLSFRGRRVRVRETGNRAEAEVGCHDVITSRKTDRQPPEAERGKAMGLPPEEHTPADTPLSSRRLISDFLPQNQKIIDLCCFKPLSSR